MCNRLRAFWQHTSQSLRLIPVIWAVFGVVTLCQQEFLPHPYADYRVFDIFPILRWYEWLSIFALLVTIASVEALYRYGAQEVARPVILDHLNRPFGLPSTRRTWKSKYLFPVIVLGVLLSYVAYRYHPAVRLSDSEITTPALRSTAIKYYALPLTLKTIFDTDFDLVMSIDDDFTLTIQQIHQPFTFRLRAFFDFLSNSIFVAIYVPSMPNSYMAASALVGIIPTLLKTLEQRYWVGLKIPGDSAETWSNNMKFSGRVFLYHEDDFSLTQLANLETRFNSIGESVEFRGQDYRVLHWNEKRAIRNKFCAPGFKINAQGVCGS
jgi:hypothetical protein